MLRRLFWNADWNDTLFMVSCAERILDNPTPHSIEAIRQAVGQEICRQSGQTGQMAQFRLIFVHREGLELLEETVFVSDPFPSSGRAHC